MNEAVKIGSHEDDDNYGNDCFALEGILRMEMIAALLIKCGMEWILRME